MGLPGWGDLIEKATGRQGATRIRSASPVPSGESSAAFVSPQPKAVATTYNPRHHWKERCDVLEAALAMNASGVNQGTSGNVSARVPGGFVITPSGMRYDELKPENMVLVDVGGGYFGPLLPSSEWRMHFDIYQHKPDAMAVVHAHPTYCTALSCQEKGIPSFHYMVAAAGAKEIKCAQYATFGTQELSNSILTALAGGARACLMANHGMICYSSSCRKALDLAIEVEGLARQYHIATAAGQPTLLGDDEMSVILAKFRTYGKQESEVSGLGAFDRKHAVIPPPRRDLAAKL